MSNTSPLNSCGHYVTEKIHTGKLSVLNYVTTDNLLQNKQGLVSADSLPAQVGNVTAYKAGDVLIANIRPYLKKLWYATQEGGCSADVLAIRASETVDSKFLYYALFRDDFFVHVMNGSKGTKMPRGDKRQIMEFLIPNFGVDEQKKIANVLSVIDKKIELNTRVNAELEAMAKTLYDYWFVQFDFPDDSPQGQGKPYKTSGGKMVYNPTLKREIPEGWSDASLVDIATFTNGIACQKYYPTGDEPTYKVIKIREFSSGFDDSSESVHQGVPEKVVVNDGDILFSWSATLEVKLWAGGTGALNQHIFKVTSDNYPKTFYYFEVLKYLEYFKMVAELRKTTMGHITKEHLVTSRICLPPKELIQAMDAKLSPILSKVISNSQQNAELEQLRDWLLPMLMNGQVTVK